VATAVAATVAAMVTPPETSTPPILAPHAPPTSGPTSEPPAAALAQLIVAYTDGGNLALVAGAGPATTLTSAGAVEQVRLSDDGARIAYTRRPAIDHPVELRVVNRDGTGDVLLMGPSDFDALYPLDGALHHDLSQFGFIPGTHILFLNTRSFFEGPGLNKHDDLLRIDTDSLARTLLLAPGTGGDVTPSPNGQYLALARPDSVEIRMTDGSPSGTGTLTYEPVITYSEYAFYAQPVWDAASEAIAFAIPSPDPLAPAPTGSVWRLPVSGSPSLLGTIPGQFLFPSGRAPLVSPDHAYVTFTRPTSAPDVTNLYRSGIDGSGETVVGPFSSWLGWSPDGAHFVYSAGDPMDLLVADAALATAPLVSGTDPAWFRPDEFVYLSGTMGAWTLQRSGLTGSSIPLASPAGDFVAFDVIYR
jgi:hypothetical protein